MAYVVLSPCPRHASGNVGDQLLLESALDLVEEIHGPTEFNVHSGTEDFTSRIEYLNSMDGILLCGFEYPKIRGGNRYRIAEDLDMVDPPLIPIGAIHRFFPGDNAALVEQRIDAPTRSFIERVVPNCPDRRIPARTDWVGEILRRNGFDTTLTGDPALFDPDFLGREFHKPEEISQLVFTTPHWAMYVDQAKELLHRLSQHFPDADRIVSLHSAMNDVDRELVDFARNVGWQINYASHEVANIELYRESDLHVGYRFHGHVAHLRWRRPSVILAEDSRAWGLTETLGTAGVRAFEPRSGLPRKLGQVHDWFPVIGLYFLLDEYGYGEFVPDRHSLVAPPNPTAVSDAIDFVDRQQEKGWESFDDVRRTVDEMYDGGMRPFLESALPPSK